jgi:antitoxin ParD1/3/4
MRIILSPEMEQYLQSKIGTGFYNNASDVIRDAIRRMREEDERVEALRAAVRRGDEQIERGEGTTYTPELLDKTMKQASVNARAGKKINLDVTP